MKSTTVNWILFEMCLTITQTQTPGMKFEDKKCNKTKFANKSGTNFRKMKKNTQFTVFQNFLLCICMGWSPAQSYVCTKELYSECNVTMSLYF